MGEFRARLNAFGRYVLPWIVGAQLLAYLIIFLITNRRS